MCLYIQENLLEKVIGLDKQGNFSSFTSSSVSFEECLSSSREGFRVGARRWLLACEFFGFWWVYSMEDPRIEGLALERGKIEMGRVDCSSIITTFLVQIEWSLCVGSFSLPDGEPPSRCFSMMSCSCCWNSSFWVPLDEFCEGVGCVLGEVEGEDVSKSFFPETISSPFYLFYWVGVVARNWSFLPCFFLAQRVDADLEQLMPIQGIAFRFYIISKMDGRKAN